MLSDFPLSHTNNHLTANLTFSAFSRVWLLKQKQPILLVCIEILTKKFSISTKSVIELVVRKAAMAFSSLPQQSSGGWIKHEVRPLVRVSALCFLYCFDIDAIGSRKDIQSIPKPYSNNSWTSRKTFKEKRADLDYPENWLQNGRE